MESEGLTLYLFWGFIVLRSIPFMKHLIAFLQGGRPPVASLQVNKEGPLCNFYSFRERKTQVLQFTAGPQHCQPFQCRVWHWICL